MPNENITIRMRYGARGQFYAEFRLGHNGSLQRRMLEHDGVTPMSEWKYCKRDYTNMDLIEKFEAIIQRYTDHATD